eukprot:GHVT01068238.1.p1 GENE.GHVT01068238.1~~GHVT01068238.1.p1  ORF type:complete len:233 (-),score=7.77 GHVT01068238.1:1625-2242(-)
MLRPRCNEQISSTVAIHDATSSSVRTLLHFLYTDKLPDCLQSALPLPTQECALRPNLMCNAPVSNVLIGSAEPSKANGKDKGDAPGQSGQATEEPEWKRLLGVLHLADIYDLPKLRYLSADRLGVCVGILHEEVCVIYEAAALIAMPGLMAVCTQRLLKILTRIRSTPEFLHLKAHPDLLLRLIDALHRHANPPSRPVFIPPATA